MAKRLTTTKGRAVVITTEWRGVFFGYVADDSDAPTKIVLTDARMCNYWSRDVKGVLGLAANGPTQGCRIGPKVPSFEAWKITAIINCTDNAVTAWEGAPWGQ
jgi:hypothetical protein